jgi:hypothetical protein
MLKEGRPGLTDVQKAELWRRWKAGQSLQEIGDALRRRPSGVQWHLTQSGGHASLRSGVIHGDAPEARIASTLSPTNRKPALQRVPWCSV